ncbi:MAG: type I glyceraldehyde-3-phosphate dehydrogenase [Kordiimonas sp.]|nr:type I glyceraldehyde-3-phosphate dehydrogenase [Kordiimonas sp.]|tara:strand:+ start:329 stop:1345 length:1017 start_codon:yes stop_codon:yes gene_type:complete
MTIRVAINGFGRMGRLALRAILEGDFPELDVVLINEKEGDAALAAHLLEFDSLHGRLSRPVRSENGKLYVDGKAITVTHFADIAPLPLQDLRVDLVLECTGVFKTTPALAPYFQRGVKKVVVSAPVKDGPLNIVMGINDNLYDPAKHHIVTAASCTTNCLAPVVKVIHENLGIRHGSMTTIHDLTNTQSIIDQPHKDFRRARACLNALIPTTTGSATAITMIYPELAGKLNGLAVRVPVLNASLTDCVFEVERPTTKEEVNAYFAAAAHGDLQGILGYEERPLVSTDYNNDTRSSIIDALSTMVINGTQVKILAWYDNEVGYATRLAELARKVARMMS